MQDEFPFPSLDFPGRTTVTVPELAEKIGVTEQHIINLIEAGELAGFDTGRQGRGRGWYRIPLESYHAFILERLNGPISTNPLNSLSTPVMRRLFKDISARLIIRGDDPMHILGLYENTPL